MLTRSGRIQGVVEPPFYSLDPGQIDAIVSHVAQEVRASTRELPLIEMTGIAPCRVDTRGLRQTLERVERDKSHIRKMVRHVTERVGKSSALEHSELTVVAWYLSANQILG